jgi:hypothetical protein
VKVTIEFQDGTRDEELTHTYLGKDGYYDFINLGPGTFKIIFPQTVNGLNLTIPNAGDDTRDSDPVNGGPVTEPLHQIKVTLPLMQDIGKMVQRLLLLVIVLVQILLRVDIRLYLTALLIPAVVQIPFQNSLIQ